MGMATITIDGIAREYPLGIPFEEIARLENAASYYPTTEN